MKTNKVKLQKFKNKRMNLINSNMNKKFKIKQIIIKINLNNKYHSNLKVLTNIILVNKKIHKINKNVNNNLLLNN